MKKFLMFLFVAVFVLVPMNLKAVSADSEKIDLKNYETSNFKEILAEEEMTLKNANYTESADQAVIYLFRGNGCAYCRAFLEYLNSISEEYGKYFRVVGFEVWYNADNGDILKDVSTFMGENASGVPYIIIGDQAFPGYAASYNDAILEAIQKTYESNNKYDVFTEYNKAIDAAIWEKNKVIYIGVFFDIIIAVIVTVVLMKYIKKQNALLLEEITGVKKVKKADFDDEEVEEVKPKTKTKKPVKKTTKKKK